MLFGARVTLDKDDLMPAHSNNTNDQNKAADEAARTARTVTDEAGRVGEQTARAGADVFRRSTETARDNLQSGLNTATQSFQRITDQFTQVLGFNGPRSEELARRSSQNLQAVSQASSVLMKGAQEVSHEVLGLVQDRLTEEHRRPEPPCWVPVGAGLRRGSERSGTGRLAASDRHQQARRRGVAAYG